MEYKLNPKHRIRDCRQVLDESISEYIRDPHHTHITACFCHFQQEEGVDYYKDMLKRKFFRTVSDHPDQSVFNRHP